MKKKIFVIVGTRPNFIKAFPVYEELKYNTIFDAVDNLIPMYTRLQKTMKQLDIFSRLQVCATMFVFIMRKWEAKVFYAYA